jgi:hypothetical protein
VITNWTFGVIGVWILLSPWLLGFANSSIAKWSNVLAGLILVVVNAWRLFGEKKS